MKYSVGYRVSDEDGGSFVESLIPLKEHISELYFPWVNISSGRTKLNSSCGCVNWGAQRALEGDLALAAESGIRLNLLLNANCYGEKAVSKEFRNYICSIIDYIEREIAELAVVTTTSPFAAQIIKESFAHITVRASVNMRIGSIDAMEQLSVWFSEFYIQRDYNRDLLHIEKLKRWADANSKSLCLLANSGCMRFCGGQTFHDNLVSHGAESSEEPGSFSPAICDEFFKNPNNHYKLLCGTWIRPEDIHIYEKYFKTVKLATRSSIRPLAVVKAYINRSHIGNVLDLLEPNHSGALNNGYISNKKLDGWFANALSCDKNCCNCNICRSAFDNAFTLYYGDNN